VVLLVLIILRMGGRVNGLYVLLEGEACRGFVVDPALLLHVLEGVNDLVGGLGEGLVVGAGFGGRGAEFVRVAGVRPPVGVLGRTPAARAAGQAEGDFAPVGGADEVEEDGAEGLLALGVEAGGGSPISRAMA
jgi:hypothetical protein